MASHGRFQPGAHFPKFVRDLSSHFRELRKIMGVQELQKGGTSV
jgi:hypothetical protein